jgi:SnoaL-like domain
VYNVAEAIMLPTDPSDIIAITQLISLYGHVADEQDQSGLSEIFVDDGVLDCSALGVGRHAGIGEIAAFFAQGKPPHPPSHHASNVVIDSIENGGARARSKWFAIDRESGGMVTGGYADRLVKTDAGWRIAERVAGVSWLPISPTGFDDQTAGE